MLVAAIQMNSGASRERNLERAAELLRRAANAGVRLAALPENFSCMVAPGQPLENAEEDGHGPVQDFLATQARTCGMWIVGGTLPIRATGSLSDLSDRREPDERARTDFHDFEAHSPDYVTRNRGNMDRYPTGAVDRTQVRQAPGRAFAACCVYDERGQRIARYDKIHLFDVELSTGESYRESERLAAGDAAQRVLVDTPAGRTGLSVCYDLRFPELFRALSSLGAGVFAVPSAFTETTGRAHWETLLRARAIENLAFVIAPGQTGEHPGGRRTFGHSMIVGPWGEVLAVVPEGEGLAIAELDAARQERLRREFPVLTHRRL